MDTLDDWSPLAGWRGRALGPAVLLPEVDSTNAEALRRIDRGAPPAAEVLVAKRQRAGHGSRGRPWSDRPGRSLALTARFEWPEEAPLALATWLGVVAVSDVLHEFGLAARLKWPNDALLRGEKVAGVLAEVRRGGAIAVALGIGVNVGHARTELPSDCATPPTSLALHGVREPPPLVARRLLDALERRTAALLEDASRGAEALRDAFLRGSGLAGRPVVATLAEGELRGRLVALSTAGELTLEQAAGRRIVHGAHVTALREVDEV
ncbi:MAG: biotin--[acetyl-CoA-carboxylase] ligase [Planctomycetes bacterium]|nr:biotin--[acetyl-CoA-carboxylase] ligase [Planctomycetota bacterium]